MGRYQIMAEYQRNERMQGQNRNMSAGSEGEVNTIDRAEIESCIVRPIRLTYEDLSAFATVKNSIQIVMEDIGADKGRGQTSKPAGAAEQFPGQAKDADFSAAKEEPKEQSALKDEPIRDAIIVFFEDAVKRMSKREALQAAREAAEKYLNTLQEFVDASEPAAGEDSAAKAPSAETDAAPETDNVIESDSAAEAAPVSESIFEPAGFGQTEYLGGPTSFGETEYLGASPSFGETEYLGGPSNFGETEYLGGSSSFGESDYLGGSSGLGESDYMGGSSGFGESDSLGEASDFEKTEYPGSSAGYEKTDYQAGAEIEKTEYLGGSSGFGETEDNQ